MIDGIVRILESLLYALFFLAIPFVFVGVVCLAGKTIVEDRRRTRELTQHWRDKWAVEAEKETLLRSSTSPDNVDALLKPATATESADRGHLVMAAGEPVQEEPDENAIDLPGVE